MLGGCDQPGHAAVPWGDGDRHLATRPITLTGHGNACLQVCEPRIPPNGRTAQARRLEAQDLLLNKTRAGIHRQLGRGPHTLSALARSLGLTNSTVLWHLAKLESAGLVQTDRGLSAPQYRQTPQSSTSLPEATRLLHSVPARELVEYLRLHPGQHLGQAASGIGAPRTRYWRVVPTLQAARLVKVVERGRRHLLFATPLAEQALRAVSQRQWASVRKRRTRRPSAVTPR
ncbi:MAG: helix-turn-helix domain-containing protein [Thermoplasmatota archaeon]